MHCSISRYLVSLNYIFTFQDVQKYRGYIGAEVGAKILVKELREAGFPESCKILDVGAGTGLVAETLKTLNFTNIDALDSSPEILEVARGKGLYKNHILGVLGPDRRIESISDNTYDAAVAMGVFTLNHVKAEGAMEEIVRVVRPGGLICFSIRGDVMFDKDFGYEEKMAELCQKKVWQLVSKSQEQYHTTKDFMKCFMFTYKVI